MANAVLTKRRFPGVMTRFSNADAPKGVVTENRSLCPASTRQVHRLHARHLWTRHSGEPSRSARAQNHRPGHHPQIVHGAGGELVPTDSGKGAAEWRLLNTVENPNYVTADASRGRLDSRATGGRELWMLPTRLK